MVRMKRKEAVQKVEDLIIYMDVLAEHKDNIVSGIGLVCTTLLKHLKDAIENNKIYDLCTCCKCSGGHVYDENGLCIIPGCEDD